MVVQNELITDKQSINIGRATDQDIFLSDLGVAYRHARITLSAAGQMGVTSLTPVGVYVDGRLMQSASMKQHGKFLVGPYAIEIRADHEGYDYDISIEQVAEDVVEQQIEEQPALKLEDTWLSRRRGAWVGFVLVLMVFLALPLAGVFDKSLRDMSREEMFLPDDSLWLSGTISKPHKHFAKDCNACHTKAFVMTPDAACIECHATTEAHADPQMFDMHSLQDARCADCHKEHNGDSFLVRDDQSLCSNCHQYLRASIDTDLANIADFDEAHAEFRPLLFVEQQPGTGEWQRVRLGDTQKVHATGIKFPHDIHLDVNGIESPSGNKVLRCDSCHQTDAGNSYMLPMEFEKHCQECHSLGFDPNTPDRELPHSDLDAMSATLDEYYALAALRGGYSNDEDSAIPEVVSRRRIPGKPLTKQERKDALQWAQDKAADVREELIEFRACGYCHDVIRDSSTSTGWRIPEVRISQRWFTKGLFDHASHVSTDCVSCHAADKSKSSDDLLMSGIENCRECHGGEHATDRLNSTCITCHVFHVPGNVTLGNNR